MRCRRIATRVLCMCAFSIGAVLYIATLLPGTASAAEGVAWQVEGVARPSYLRAGQSAQGSSAEVAVPVYRVGAREEGAASVEGVKVEVELPVGVEPSTTVPAVVKTGPTFEPCLLSGQTVTCESSESVPSGREVVVLIPLNVAAEGSELGEAHVAVTSANGRPFSGSFETSAASPYPGLSFIHGGEGLFAGAYDESGAAVEAGGHPFVFTTGFNVPTVESEEGKATVRGVVQDPLRSIQIKLPSGMVINPEAVPGKCARFEAEGEGKGLRCPAESQVGLAHFDLLSGLIGASEAVYLLQTPSDVPAELVFGIQGVNVYLRGGVDGEFHLTAESREILSRFSIPNVVVELWGVPSDSRHDWARKGANCVTGCGVRQSPAAFLTMPSACSSSLVLGGAIQGWLGGSDAREVALTDLNGSDQATLGCERLPFHPSISVQAGSATAERPSGLSVNLTIPQSESPFGLASATMKKVVLRLPPGMRVNPSVANGLAACSQAEIGLGTNEPASCPDASKVGSAEIKTPLLDAPLKGSLFLAEQRNNPFGSLLALYLAVEGKGIVVKLSGRVEADSESGQLTAIFDNSPQLPFSELQVQLNGGDGGPRASLVTPPTCGSYTSRTEITSWASSAPVVLESPMKVDQGCSTGGFSPGFEAGTTNPIAGRFSPFTLRVTRQDGEQNLSRISATLPEGLLAKLSGVPLCPDAQATTDSCPAASQIGTTTTGVGAGDQPLYIPQPGKSPTAVYLSGPYRGAPYSLVVKVPAQAGPFDLGTIAVRVALDVDPFTAQVTAMSDPLPQILEGIPITYRDVRIDISRTEFIVNPTSCEPKQIASTLTSIAGAQASPSSRFQVAGCANLGFKPSLKLSLKGSTKRTGHPALKAVVTYPKKGAFANIARAQVNLPHSVFLDQGNLNKTCTRPLLLAGNCPRTSVYGKAKAWTPLLEKPLEGPVYLVGGFGYKLPALVADLNGQLRVLLKGKVDTGPNQGIRNTFEAVPDAPVTRFVLEMKGGKKYSLLENSEPLCREPQNALARFTAQNGSVEQSKPRIAVECRKKKNTSRK